MLVLAAPLDATIEQLAELRGVGRPSLVIDVASVKVPIARAAAGMAGFVATHPLAGSERSGPAAAHAGLFEGKTWAYDAEAPAADAHSVRSFILEMGGRPLPMELGRHDRIVALTSHVPQLLSVLLGAHLDGRLDDPDVAALSGTGMASMLRLAKSAWPVWEPILASNADAIAQEVRELAAILLHAAQTLEASASARFEVDFLAAAHAAARLDPNGSPRG
jgi:prephenate dehydrogenase